MVTPEQVKTAQAYILQKGGKLSDALLALGMIKPEDLAVILSIHLNLPLIDLKRHAVQAEALAKIPEEMARKRAFIPLDIVNDSLLVVMADPEDVRTIEDIKVQAGMRLEVALGVRSDIERAINIHYRSSSAIQKNVNQLSAEEKKSEEQPVYTAITPIAETLDLLVAQAVKDRASDVHIEPQEDRLRIRFRIDGILHDMFSFPLNVHPALVSRIKILSEMDISEQRRPQDGQFSIKVGNNTVDIRSATMDTPNGERVTLRILDKSLALFTLEELGFRADVLKFYRAMLKSPLGMLLVAGPTGSGKTTTLYASINELNRNERNIMTIEDPIEYSFMDINQTQVNNKAGLTFAGGLRAIMRHDPDVILVGEIRDKETAVTAVQAALTGHFVFSSIHANDTVSMMSRVIDLGVEPGLVSSTLIGLVAQRMVRRICTNCRSTVTPTPAEQSLYMRETGQELPLAYKGAGCHLCANTGYRGRVGVFELLAVTEGIQKKLVGRAGIGEIREQAVRDGVYSMKRDGLQKIKEGITTFEEVMGNLFTVS